MGNFIGHFGAFLLLGAAAMLVFVFCSEAGIIKNKALFSENIKTAVFTVVIGMIYYFIIAYIYNNLHGKTNIFDFEKLFSFSNIDKTMQQCISPDFADCISGASLFPYIVHIIGKSVFSQYIGTALFLNFLGTAIGMCFLRCTVCELFKTDMKPHSILLALPYTFYLFTPGGFGVAFCFICIAAYTAICKKNYILYLIFTLIAILTSKIGFFAIIPGAIAVTNTSFPKLLKPFGNAYIRKALLYVILLANTLVMLLTLWR